MITRREAAEILARHDLAELRAEERESLLQDWWSVGAEDPDYHRLPELVRVMLARNEGPDDPQDPIHDHLLILALRRTYVGVINDYLQRRLSTLGHPVEVDGDVEWLHACRCCGYRTLARRAQYDVCPVCFWEDDGTSHEDGGAAGPNHMTLGEARRTFEETGASSTEHRGHVLADGVERYVRASFDPPP
jgi:hypothetical protein